MKTILVFIIVVFFFATEIVGEQNYTIPGGVATLHNGTVVFYNFAKNNLTPIGPAPESVYAVAKNGDLIYTDQGKFWLIRFNWPKNYQSYNAYEAQKQAVPIRWYSIDAETLADKESRHSVKPLPSNGETWVPPIGARSIISFKLPVGQAKNLALSPNGNAFSFELNAKTFAFGIGIDTHLIDKSGIDGFFEAGWLTRVGNDATYNGGTGLSLIGLSLTLTPMETMKRFSFPRAGMFGAWAELEYVPPDLTALAKSKSKVWPSDIKRAQQESLRKKLLAVALLYPDGLFRTIELRDQTNNCFYKGKPLQRGDKPGMYEIPVMIKNILHMAWTPPPQNHLTILLGDGSVISFDGERIRKGIAGSGLAKNPIPTVYIPVPINNVFNIQPTLVAKDIVANRFEWISENQFIFRNKDESLMLWDNGKITQLLKYIPETFFYCNPPSKGEQMVALKN